MGTSDAISVSGLEFRIITMSSDDIAKDSAKRRGWIRAAILLMKQRSEQILLDVDLVSENGNGVRAVVSENQAHSKDNFLEKLVESAGPLSDSAKEDIIKRINLELTKWIKPE